MPIYEYRTESGRTFELFVRRADEATETAVDPQTGEVGTRIISGAGFAFKGSGFYLTDYGKNAHRSGSAPAKPSESASGTTPNAPAASSGGEALELLNRTRFDLVLMDLQMPQMSGVEAARRIKSNPANARVPIIAMSADTLDGLAETGMDDYLLKPVEPDALLAKVRRWLSA